MASNSPVARPQAVRSNLPADLTPRERLLRRGAAALSDAELVSVILLAGFRRPVRQRRQRRQLHRPVVLQRIANKANVPGLENVAHLERLPATGAWVVALPMKIAGGSGGPVRIVALLPG